MIRALILAFSLLSRIPMPTLLDITDRDWGRSGLMYPVVGLFFGFVLHVLAEILGPGAVSAVLLVAVWAGLTGGLHLDGLGDTLDAWTGGMGDKERTLAIMKDPAVGPHAAAGLALVLMLKAAAVHHLLQAGRLELLIVAPLLGRAALTALFVTTPYAVASGMGRGMSDALSAGAGWLSVTAAALLTIYLVGAGALTVLGIAALTLFLARWSFMIRLGGTTGDTAGALCELVEAAVLAAAVLA